MTTKELPEQKYFNIKVKNNSVKDINVLVKADNIFNAILMVGFRIPECEFVKSHIMSKEEVLKLELNNSPILKNSKEN